MPCTLFETESPTGAEIGMSAGSDQRRPAGTLEFFLDVEVINVPTDSFCNFPANVFSRICASHASWYGSAPFPWRTRGVAGANVSRAVRFERFAAGRLPFSPIFP